MVLHYNQEERHHAQRSGDVYKTNTGTPGGSPTGCLAHPCTCTPTTKKTVRIEEQLELPLQTKLMFVINYCSFIYKDTPYITLPLNLLASPFNTDLICMFVNQSKSFRESF